MPKATDHPNEPGKWKLLDHAGTAALWRRDRSDPVPVTLFYVLAPPQQAQVVYDEAVARAQFSARSSMGESQVA